MTRIDPAFAIPEDPAPAGASGTRAGAGAAHERLVQVRNEALRVLMHDLKATQSSMLSLLELRRLRLGAVSDEQFSSLVESGARRALRLCRDLGYHAFAGTGEYALHHVDLVDTLGAVVAGQRARALENDLRLEFEGATGEVFCSGNGELLARALEILLDAAIDAAGAGTAVTIRLEAGHQGVRIGMMSRPGADVGRALHPHGSVRDDLPVHERTPLALAALVAQVHRGRLASRVDDSLQQLWLVLPAH